MPLHLSVQEQPASTAHAGKLIPARRADRRGHEVFPKPAALGLPMSRLRTAQA